MPEHQQRDIVGATGENLIEVHVPAVVREYPKLPQVTLVAGAPGALGEEGHWVFGFRAASRLGRRGAVSRSACRDPGTTARNEDTAHAVTESSAALVASASAHHVGRSYLSGGEERRASASSHRRANIFRSTAWDRLTPVVTSVPELAPST